MTSVELSTELESIILDTVMRVPISKSRRPDTNSPMDFGMAAKGDHDETKGDEELRIADFAVPAVVHKCRTQRHLALGQRPALTQQCGSDAEGEGRRAAG